MTKERFQELLKPIADGLFGKQRTRYGEMPHYTVRPVGMIVEDLCRIPEDEWAKYAFSREPLNGKFNDEQRLDLTRQAHCLPGVSTLRSWRSSMVCVTLKSWPSSWA